MTGEQITEWRDYFAERMQERFGLPKEGAQVWAEEWLQSVFGESDQAEGDRTYTNEYSLSPRD